MISLLRRLRRPTQQPADTPTTEYQAGLMAGYRLGVNTALTILETDGYAEAPAELRRTAAAVNAAQRPHQPDAVC